MSIASTASVKQAPRPTSARDLVAAYVALTKPRIIELLLVTTVPPMILAADGLPSWSTVVLTLIGGTLAAGSANTANCYVDRDIDQVMHRTARRPLARHVVPPVNALRFGVVLGVLSVLILGLGVNWLSAGMAVAAILFYVFVYTLGLKRRSSSNIVIGGAAGCFPTLIGWSAVTGTVGWPAFVLFAVVFLWTPPHFWSLAIRYRDDYAAAHVPMLPVVAAPDVVTRRIIIYSWLMVAASLPLAWPAGWPYAIAAVLLGGWFCAQAHLLHRRVTRGQEARPMVLFHASTTYLALLFLAVAVSPLIV